MNILFNKVRKQFQKPIVATLIFCCVLQSCTICTDFNSMRQSGTEKYRDKKNNNTEEFDENPVRQTTLYKIDELSVSGEISNGLDKCPSCQIIVHKKGICSGFWIKACIAIIFLIIGGVVTGVPVGIYLEANVVAARADTALCNAKLAINQDCKYIQQSLCSSILASSCASLLTNNSYC